MKLEFLDAGQIVSTHGVRGEVKVLPWADGPEFLTSFKRICIEGTEYKVENCRIQKTCNLLKLAGVDTVEDGQKLREKTVRVYRDDAPKGLIFAAELMGVQVYADDVYIGDVTDVLDYPGNKVYVVRGEFEYMIPAVKEFVQLIDIDANKMEVKLIKGMRTDEN